MARKTIAIFVVASFAFFNLSCHRPTALKTVAVDPAKIAKSKRSFEILSVVTKEGKTVEFQKGSPGGLDAGRDAVVGTAFQYFEIGRDEIESFAHDQDGKTGTIVTRDGRTYRLVFWEDVEDRVRFSAYVPVSIPLADIHQVWIVKRDSGRLAVYALAGIAAGVVGYILVRMAAQGIADDLSDNWESCPFVYSWNGAEYVLDAEPYGAAVTEGLKRTDWIEMSNLRPEGGKYRVLLTNELDETQFTDELKLVAVDHAPGAKIAPDLSGGIHSFDRLQAPAAAFDRDGRDILPFVAANDRAFWLSPLEGRDPDGTGDFRDELVFEFPKPAGATKARLLTNVWTTTWASMSAGRFLELYGSSLEAAYRDVDRHGPTFRLFQAWMESEELYRLKIWVETPGGWKARGTIFGGAPVVTKDKACVLDVGDVPGEVLRIKLRPPVNFWMVNSLAVDYGEGSPVRMTELAAEKAVDRDGRDVRPELAATDGLYLEDPDREGRTELVFAAPPLGEGLERTVLAKASGYYRIHVENLGEPRTELIGRVLGEAGFAARFSFREYLEWEAGLRAGARGQR